MKQADKIKPDKKLDLDVEERINKHPRKVRKHLKMLYEEYKKGNLIFPEGFDKGKFLNKQ